MIKTFEDLVQIIETHPEWRRRLKRALFDIDIEAALTRLEKAIEELVAVQRKQGSDIAELKSDVAVLKTDVATLKTDMVQVKGDVKQLKSDMSQVKGDVAQLKGKSYEVEYYLKASGIFGRFIRRGRNRTDDIGEQLYEAQLSGKISEHERTQVLAADLVWGGKTFLNGEDVIVILEASWRAEPADINRAQQRAAILRKLGIQVVPVVAAMEWNEETLTMANSSAVAVASNGQIDADSWENAISVSKRSEQP